MKISPIINANYNTSFNSKIIPTEEWNDYLKFVNQYAIKKAGYCDTIQNKRLIKEIITAIKQNPSDANIEFDVFYRKDEGFNARGVMRSQYGTFTDTEPTRSDSNVKIENIIRRIFYPENRQQMYKLFGALGNSCDEAKQEEWWNRYIKPIWQSIQETFYEPHLYNKNQNKLNRQFREQNSV